MLNSNWPTKKLGDISYVSGGGSAPQGKGFFNGGKYPFFRTSDVGDVHLADNLQEVRDYLNEEGIKKLNLFKKGTILFPKSGASTFLNHRVVMGCDGYVSSHLATITCKECVHYKYLYYFLILIDTKDIAPNSSYPSLRISDIAKLEIPLPPIYEQKKIVAKLEKQLAKIKEAKRLRIEALTATQSLLSAELHKIFKEGDSKYPMDDLGNVAKLVRGPFGGSLKKEIFVKSGDCVYEQGNVIDNDLKNFRYFITPEKFQEMRRFEVFAGDILMSCSGTIGKFVIIQKNYKKGIINQALLKITPNEKIIVKYLKYALEEYLAKSITHVKGMAIKNIAAVKELKMFKIPLPSLPEQKKIVAQLDTLSEKIKKLEQHQKQSLADLERLEKSILHSAFEGNYNQIR